MAPVPGRTLRVTSTTRVQSAARHLAFRGWPANLCRTGKRGLRTGNWPTFNRKGKKGGATMLELDQALRERHSTRMFLPHQLVSRELLDEAPSPWPSVPRRTPTSSRGTSCSCPERRGIASSRPCSTRPRLEHAQIPLATKSFGSCFGQQLLC
jgi:hypothetical protein